MLVIDCPPASVDSEFPALFRNPVLSLLPAVELRYHSISANAVIDFDGKGPIIGFMDQVSRSAHRPNMRP